MHVLLLDQFFCPMDGFSNTQSYELAQRLVRAEHQVTVVTSTACIPGAVAGSHAQVMDGINVIALPEPEPTEQSAFWPNLGFACRALWTAFWRPRSDVVLSVSPALTLSLAGLLLSLIKRKPFILDVRELRPAVAIALGQMTNPFTKAAARLCELAVLSGADHIIAASDGLKNALFGKGVSGTKVTVVPGGGDIARFRVGQDSGAAFLNDHPGLKDGPVVLVPDGMEKATDVAFVTDLAAAVQQAGALVHFVVLGGNQQSAAVARARELGLLERCFWALPAVSRDDLPSAFSAATVVLSSLKPIEELHLNAPRTVFDAFAAARPVAITYGGWLEHLVDARAVGVVLPRHDIATASSELIDFLSDEVRLRRAGEAAAALADTRYNQDKLGQSVLRLLEAAAND